MKQRRQYLTLWLSLFIFSYCSGQDAGLPLTPTRHDTLRGSITPARAWWDVTHYDITVEPDFDKKRISGTNKITFKVTAKGNLMQIDLQQPMEITSLKWKNKSLRYTRDSNVFLIRFPETLLSGSSHQLIIRYAGNPREAVMPPWDGGWIWKKDKQGNPWMSVACQGLGASVWYPCKDHQSDEPDSAVLRITVPDSLAAVGNGRLRSKLKQRGGKSTYTWGVTNPINNYNIIPYIGKYDVINESFNGEQGKLDISYWVMKYNVDTAKKHFSSDVHNMLKCFEHWFGPYPFYKDGYKLVEAPHLGMEHQSAVAYGNQFKKGYAGKDLSASGWGLKWDFIIIHESGHEWFGNNITTKDVADMWVHEGFTNYSETIFTGCQFGEAAATDYVTGIRKLIENDSPITGIYEVNKEGSGDMYYKGGNLIHTIRQVINNDEKFRTILRGLNSRFRHQTVTGEDVEKYISTASGIDFSKVFDQYLRTVSIPVFEYNYDGMSMRYRWTNVINGFNMPLKITRGHEYWIKPTTEWQTLEFIPPASLDVIVDSNFYVEVKKSGE